MDRIIPTWTKAGFPDVRVMNFHDDRQHITSSFYCDMVPNAPHTCQYTLKRYSNKNTSNSSENPQSQPQSSPNKENSNSVSNAHYNNIVFEAAKRNFTGLDTVNQTRLEAVHTLINYHVNLLGLSYLNLPLICPSRSLLEKLLNKSLAFERKMMPKLFASRAKGVAYHKQSFWDMADKKKEFCTVNTALLFAPTNANITSWDELLSTMKRTEWPMVEITE